MQIFCSRRVWVLFICHPIPPTAANPGTQTSSQQALCRRPQARDRAGKEQMKGIGKKHQTKKKTKKKKNRQGSKHKSIPHEINSAGAASASDAFDGMAKFEPARHTPPHPSSSCRYSRTGSLGISTRRRGSGTPNHRGRTKT